MRKLYVLWTAMESGSEANIGFVLSAEITI